LGHVPILFFNTRKSSFANSDISIIARLSFQNTPTLQKLKLLFCNISSEHIFFSALSNHSHIPTNPPCCIRPTALSNTNPNRWSKLYQTATLAYGTGNLAKRDTLSALSRKEAHPIPLTLLILFRFIETFSKKPLANSCKLWYN